MERLPGLLAGDPVYWIEDVTPLGHGRLGMRLGFSDVAAHPYERLVAGTVEMLARTPGVETVVHGVREVVEITARGLTAEHLGGLVDRFWFERLPLTPIDPSFRTSPADVLASPWPAAPPPPRGVGPTVRPDAGRPTISALRQAVALPPSRLRLWTYLVVGAVCVVGALVLAFMPGGREGATLPMALGAINLVVGARIARRRLRAGFGLV